MVVKSSAIDFFLKSYSQGIKMFLQTNLESATALYNFFNMFKDGQKICWCRLDLMSIKSSYFQTSLKLQNSQGSKMFLQTNL